MTTKRDKLRAMADQTASPEEAAIAKAMLSKTANTPEEKLEVIADDIKAEWGKGIEVELRIGALLQSARDLFGGNDKGYGAWLKEQDFPFAASTATNLRIGYERREEVLGLIAARRSSASRDIGVNLAVKLLQAKPKPVADGSENDDAGELIPVTDATAPDPAYATFRAGAQAIVGTDEEPKNAFLNMHVEDLAKCAAHIKALVAAYTEAKGARSA